MVNGTFVNITANLTSLGNVTAEPGFFQVLLNPTLLTFAIPIILIAVIFIFVLRNVMPVSHFLYANARIQARTNYTVSEAMLRELSEAKSLKEIGSLLRETIYADELEKSKEGLREMHAALEKGFVDSILELVELSPDKSKSLFEDYLMFFEAKILKIIYRARFMKIDIDESLIYNIGVVDDNLLKHLLGTESVADIGVVMKPTRYAQVFEKEYTNLEEFEVDIDEFVFNNFVESIERTKMHDGKYIIDMLNKKIDILNLLALLKLRVRGIEKEKQKDRLIDNKGELCLKFDKLIESEKLSDFVDKLKEMPYYEGMKKALERYEKDNALSHFENELYRWYKKFVIDNDLSHTLGPYPLFSYLIKRELELRNLFVISKGVDAGFSNDKITEMIV